MITVTKSFVPPKEDYIKYVESIFDSNVFTNQGPCVKELEKKLNSYLELHSNIHFVSNGTIALQIALRALNIADGEIITTPFSYVATVSSILWERCVPIFVDIEPDNFMINPELIESSITEKTMAIMPVHVFGYACNTEQIEKIAYKYNIKVIYDGAHCFGVKYKNNSLLNYGDISTCSFHATKLFHTIEGGACITKNNIINQKLELIKRFGHEFDNHICVGINAKNSEFHAAMGLVNLKYISNCIEIRRHICDLYDSFLIEYIQRPKFQAGLAYNYSYYPVVFENEKQLLRVFSALHSKNIFPRRYFYPSLNKLPYLHEYLECPVSENIASRIACLPLYIGLKNEEVEMISKIIVNSL